MSLTSYRAAPPRVTKWAFVRPGRSCLWSIPTASAWTCGLLHPAGLASWLKDAKRATRDSGALLFGRDALTCGWVFFAPAAMPGDVLLFQRLSVSTIGAVRFHGRVRDGIGWVTDAMVTKQWSGRVLIDVVSVRSLLSVLIWLDDRPSS